MARMLMLCFLLLRSESRLSRRTVAGEEGGQNCVPFLRLSRVGMGTLDVEQ